MKGIKILGIIALAVIICVIASCGKGGTIEVKNVSGQGIDAASSRDSNIMDLSVFDKISKRVENGKTVSWTYDEDGYVYTFWHPNRVGGAQKYFLEGGETKTYTHKQ